MDSRNREEEKAEGAARYAADEIKLAREERDSQQQLHRDYATPRGTTTTLEEQEYQKNRPGIISSVVGALGSTYEHAKEAVSGKTHDAAEKTREAAEAASQSMQQSRDSAAVRAREKAELAREGRDNTAESLRQTKDKSVGATKDAAGYVADTAVSAKDKTVGATKDAAGYAADTAVSAKDKTVGATKDAAGYAADTAVSAKDKTVGATEDAAGYVGDKTRDAKDYTAEKAKEGKDSTVGKLTELKDRAMGYLSGKKDETKEKVGETAQAVKDKTYETKEEAKDVYKGTEDEARRKMEERRIENLRDKGYNTVVDEDALRGEAGKNNTIFGAIGNMAEAVKSKLTMPGDAVEGGSRRSDEGREVTVTVEESPPGAASDILRDVKKTGGGVGVGEVADLLKNADQITGQSFSRNDVGKMGGERTTRR